MDRARAYAALTTELEHWRGKTSAELVSRIGITIPSQPNR